MQRLIHVIAAAGLTLGLAAPALSQTIVEVERCIGGAGEQIFTSPYTVKFDVDSTDIKADFMGQMEQAVKTIKGQKPLSVCLIGSTDKTGSVEYNKKLAVKRAHSVGNKLVEMGVDPTVLKVVTDIEFSKQKLLSSVIGEDRPAERRVDIVMVK